MKMLNLNDPDFLQKFRSALGLKDGEGVEFITPQFERADGITPTTSVDSWSLLRQLSISALKQLGCGQWDAPDEHGLVLMLFPKEWYGIIPNGYQIECIGGESETFCHGQTDDDYRFGCLAYGIKVMA